MSTEEQRNSLFRTLASASIDVHERLSDGQKYGVDPGEETLTDNLLLALKRAQPNVVVTKFTRIVESRKTGADWEWWWEGEREWFGAVVQAKKLVALPHGDHGYMFGYRGRNAECRQIDVLLDYAERSGLPGIYALYNGPSFDSSPTGPALCTGLDERMWGVSVIPAPVAAHLLSLRQCSQVAVNSVARPLACQLCSGTQDCEQNWIEPEDRVAPATLGFDRLTSVLDPAYLAAEAMMLALEGDLASGIGRQASTRVDINESLAVSYVRAGVRRPPEYALRALDSQGSLELSAESNEPERLLILRRPPSQ